MWSRVQLKEKAKYALKVNYWKVVIVAFLLTIIVGGIASGTTYNYTTQLESTDTDSIFGDEGIYGDDFNNDLYDDMYGDMYGDDFEDMFDEMFEGEDGAVVAILIIFIVFIVLIVVLVIALVVSFVWSAFIGNPVLVGANRFFFKSLNEKAEVKELLYTYDSNFKNIAQIMFYKTLYETLWTFLFIIPGIVKAYEYRMIPYLLAENPNLTKEQAFALSKQMMDGQKWDAFVLDLSFLGWEILSAFTGGILGYFYVTPYRMLTEAALYEELSLRNGRPAVVEPVVNNTYDATSYQAPETDSYNKVEE